MTKNIPTRAEKEQTVSNIQDALYLLVQNASEEQLKQALQGFIISHNHLTCMYCSISPQDCDTFGLLTETLLNDTEERPIVLKDLSSQRLCKSCRQMLDTIDGLFCQSCSEV